MTWVIAATTIFGYGVAVSDICVTLGDGTQRDLLRKTYPVGKFIVAGFAGSVRIGFEMIADLRNFLRMYEDEEGYCWQPGWVAENWPPRAREIFDRYDETEKALGSEVMLVGVDPDEKALGGGRPGVALLRGPEYEPEIERSLTKVLSIGSGSGRCEAMDTLARTVDNVDLMQAEVANPGGFGKLIGSSMTRDLFFEPPRYVSRHLHISIVGLNRLSVVSNDMAYYPPEGEPIHLRMPKVAESFPELCEMLDLTEAEGVALVATAQHARHDSTVRPGLPRGAAAFGEDEMLTR